MHGKTLLDHALDNLRGSDVRRVVVNVHYLAGQVEAHLARNAADLDITVSDEREALLETGGGVAKALPPFPSDPHYDAKAWETMTARKGPGRVVFWNVAGPSRP